jgi:signal transduction histidine kinase
MMQRRNLVRGENELASMTPKTVLRTLKIQLIAVLILFTVASALIVIYRFGRTIASRIAITSENTRRLPQRVPLHPPITGDDEIAQMDHAFHDMADALAAAQLRRQEYISMISHDIKTPLTSIYGSVEYLDTGCGGELTEKGFHMTARAMRNIERVLSLINSLLYVEQLEAGMANITITDESLKRLVEEAVESIQDLAEKQNVRVVSSVEDVQVAVDARRTEQVLINLFSNALKFSPHGSSIEVSSHVRGNEIELSVTDHGRGVPPDAQEKIFHRFQQVEESDATERGGHGLGLAICRAIVSAQGGSIGVTSTPGQGATFWFTMKRADNLRGSG